VCLSLRYPAFRFAQIDSYVIKFMGANVIFFFFY